MTDNNFAPINILLVDGSTDANVRLILEQFDLTASLRSEATIDGAMAALAGGGYHVCLVVDRPEGNMGMQVLRGTQSIGSGTSVIVVSDDCDREQDLLNAGAVDVLGIDECHARSLKRALRHAGRLVDRVADVETAKSGKQGLVHDSEWFHHHYKDMFGNFMDNSPALSFIKDEEGRYIYGSRPLLRFYGLNHDQLIGKTDHDFWPTETADEFRQTDLITLAAGVPVAFMEHAVNDTGEHYAHVIKFPLQDPSGRQLLGGLAIETTDSVQAQKKLEQVWKLNQAILQSLSAHIAVIDTDGVIVTTNQAWDDFGSVQSPPALIGLSQGVNYLEKCQAAMDQVHPEASKIYDGLRCVLSGDVAEFRAEYPCQTSLGLLWFIMSATRLQGLGGAVISHIDTTERKHSEAILRQAHHKLEVRMGECTAEITTIMARLERTYSAQKRFVADASHDLRIPLTVISAELGLLLTQKEHSDATRKSLQHIASYTRQLDELTNDMLMLASLDSGDYIGIESTVRIDELVLEHIAGLTPLAREKEIVWNIQVGESAEIYCSATSLGRAIANILENAIKYSTALGVVRVAIKCSEGDCQIVVENQGFGILPEELPRVFDRFYRTDHSRSTPGTGLGLSIAKSVVDAHHGTINITSTPEVGTVVTINIPTRILVS